MYRRLLWIIILCMIIGAWCSSTAPAFTVYFKPVAQDIPSIVGSVSEDDDVPTPQLFHFALDADGLTLGRVRLYDRDSMTSETEVFVPDDSRTDVDSRQAGR